VEYAPPSHWDREFRRRLTADDDLDWGDRWTGPFAELLRRRGARTVLDLGCGSGNDARRLREQGFSVTGLDFSQEALVQARAKPPGGGRFVTADLGAGLPFRSASFDAVMSNVALHMFGDRITRGIFAELRRLPKPGGLLLLHLNAAEDRPLRALRKPVLRELEPDCVLERSGQTVRFFSESYLQQLLAGWDEVELEPIEIRDLRTGEPFKRVWRVVAAAPQP
jgi:SAM-dependent methyltransferase